VKRILVVDDERPVVEAILHIVKRDLAGEFEIAGTASSGREAIDRAQALSPDIVLMDVRMPGISGLDAIREMRRRGSEAVFVLITAYERFDIALEAVELGVSGYLLKPVARDKLAATLRAAAVFIDRRGELERRDIEDRERREATREFAETSFLHGIMLGEELGAGLSRYRSALDLVEPFAAAMAAAFFPASGSLDAAAEARALHDRFRATLRYKSKALVGPLVAGSCAAVIPLRLENEAAATEEKIREALAQAQGLELARGQLRLGFGSPRPIEELRGSWIEALRRLWCDENRGAGSPEGDGFEDDETFLEALLDGSVDRARASLERLLAPLRGLEEIAPTERFRMVSVLSAAYRRLARRGLIDAREARAELDLGDVSAARSGPALELVVAARFSRITDALARSPRRSPALTAAIGFVKSNFGGLVTLELAADAVGLSPNRLSRLFVDETGRGFSDYLIDYRIERAKELLSMPGASIKQVSAACGYPDPNYFSRLFKKVTGLTPTAFSSGTTEANDDTR